MPPWWEVVQSIHGPTAMRSPPKNPASGASDGAQHFQNQTANQRKTDRADEHQQPARRPSRMPLVTSRFPVSPGLPPTAISIAIIRMAPRGCPL